MDLKKASVHIPEGEPIYPHLKEALLPTAEGETTYLHLRGNLAAQT